MGGIVIVIVIVLLILVVIALATMVRVLQEYERAVIFRLGNVLRSPKGPGIFFLLPFGIDRMRKVNLQTVAMNVPPQDIITRDSVTLRVDAVVYSRVVEPVRAVVEIQNYLFATSQAAQTNLRAILGRKTLDELLSSREEINAELSAVIAGVTAPWGVRVTSVEIKDVDLPEDLQRAMAHEAEAARDAKALKITADAELTVSHVLAEAASVMAQNPSSLQLRFLQTVAEVATERNSTLVMPIPIELLNFVNRMGQAAPQPNGAPPPLPTKTPTAGAVEEGTTAPRTLEPGSATAPLPPVPGSPPEHERGTPGQARRRPPEAEDDDRGADGYGRAD
ncbi:MAG TPA: slipin family protein [Actinomycetes bacterium]|nr:slipin family protein [Actinomycetes bacterium]